MALINFTVTYDQLATQTDDSDTGADADIIALIGTVTFTPEMSDDGPLLAPGYSPRAAGFKLLPITGYVDSDGQLKSARAGTVGVRLPANDPVLQLTRLVYRVSFDLRTPLGEPVPIRGGYFEAPSTDTTVNLTNVLVPTGEPSIGVINGGIDDVVAVGDSIQFYWRGSPVGNPIPIAVGSGGTSNVDGGNPTYNDVFDGGTPTATETDTLDGGTT